jgi:hypothetical protein
MHLSITLYEESSQYLEEEEKLFHMNDLTAQSWLKNMVYTYFVNLDMTWFLQYQV